MVFPLAWGADVDELTELTKPESTFRLGLGYLNGDNPPFGLYSGVRKQGTYGAASFNYVRRDDASGTWYRAYGRNLGMDGPEARVEHERQGDWGYFIDFNRITRFDPLRINTGLTGIDTASQAINGTAGREVRLSTERDRFRLGFDKRLNHGLDFQLRYSTESKNGSRLFGRGTGQFLTEPINSRTHQVEALLGYTGEALQLSGGYYGTAYKNQYSVLDVLTGTDIALAPDNQSHQLHLSGGYSFSPTTRATFKIAQGRGLQNESFFTAPDFSGNVQSSLNGRVDTKSAQFGLSARPLPKLSVLMNLRYEDRDDKTPRYQFLAASTSRDGFNTPFSRTTRNAKLEASYALPLDLRLTGGVEVDERKRSVLAVRQVSWREKNDETSYRVELRRSLSDTLNGALSVVHSERGGSQYLPANNNAAADVIDPLHFADRKRNKLRLSLDWVATESLSFQLLADESRDTYDGRPLGPELGKARMLSLDADYRISEDWHSVAWISREQTDIHQSTLTGANGTTIGEQLWKSRLRNVGDAFGVGLRGKPTGQLEVGIDLQWARDLNSYAMLAAIPDAARLPDIDSRRYTLRMFANYELKKNLGVRLDLIHDRFRTNDWTWTGWTYADGTTVTQDPRLSTTFVGVSMMYRMW